MPAPEDLKRAQIRKHAYAIMLRYGFQRTSMDDIARQCGVSRPALYLTYKNKEDIYRDVVQSIAEECIAVAGRALDGKGDRKAKVLGIIRAGFMDVAEAVMASPHGAELLDLKSALTQDIAADWRLRITGLIAKAIGSKEARARADLIMDAIDGLKARTTDIQELRAGIQSIVRLALGG